MDCLHRLMRCIFLAFDICFHEVLHWRQHVWNQRWIEQIEQQAMWTSFGGLCIAKAFSISNEYVWVLIFLSIYRHVEANILARMMQRHSLTTNISIVRVWQQAKLPRRILPAQRENLNGEERFGAEVVSNHQNLPLKRLNVERLCVGSAIQRMAQLARIQTNVAKDISWNHFCSQ